MILLKNGTFIDWQTLEFRKTDILVEPGKAGKLTLLPSRVAGEDGREKRDITVIDCNGKYITRSFANAHHHAYSALARGMPAPVKKSTDFCDILRDVWWNLDKALDLEMIWWSGLVTAIDCAKRGVTFVIDHHASPNAVKGSLETLAKAFEAVGLGHLFCYEISDRDGAETAIRGLKETAEYLEYRQGLVGLHASFTVGRQTLEMAVELASGTKSGIHIHVAEDRADQDHCLENFGKLVVTRLKEAGVIDFPKTILAHCLHLDDRERSLVAESPAWIVENMESNLNNRVGAFNAKGLGTRIMLGTDGIHSDMLQSARAACLAGRTFEEISVGEAYWRLRNVHRYLESNQFTGDGENNLVVLSYDPPTPFSKENFTGHFIFGLESRHISQVISQGRLIIENGIMLTADEPAILDEARKQATRLWAKMSR